ncbi:MAG: hypothetical protein ABWY49_06580, partial [Rhizobium sp.]
ISFAAISSLSWLSFTPPAIGRLLLPNGLLDSRFKTHSGRGEGSRLVNPFSERGWDMVNAA